MQNRAMTYYPDLSEYVYSSENRYPNALNVGWLDASHAYSSGEVSREFRDRLFELCSRPVSRTRGWHPCPFCNTYPTTIERDGKKLTLGSAEIRVFAQGSVYAAPDLVYHYVESHGYAPPSEFMEAVLATPAT